MDRQTLLRCEINLYAHCARRVNTAFGVLYYNGDNANSHDCNHAHLTRLGQPDGALELIEAFYLSRGVTPRIFFSGVEDELETLRPHLLRRGWEIEESVRKVLCLKDFTPPDAPPPDGLVTVRMQEMDDELFALFVENDGGGDWCAKAARESMACGSLSVFAALVDGVKVGSAGIDRDADTGLLLVQDVFINERWRGRGYSAPMVAAAIADQRRRHDGEIYLWVENPIAERVYRRLGFVDVPFTVTDWRACKPVSNEK